MKYVYQSIKLSFLLMILTLGIYAQTQFDLNIKACAKLQKAEAEMNKMLGQIYTDYKDDQNFIVKMKKAQSAWEKFYEAQIEAVFPNAGDNPKLEYGSVYPMCDCQWRENFINDRIKQLKVWADGIEEGDVCTGSVKIAVGKPIVKPKKKQNE